MNKRLEIYTSTLEKILRIIKRIGADNLFSLLLIGSQCYRRNCGKEDYLSEEECDLLIKEIPLCHEQKMSLMKKYQLQDRVLEIIKEKQVDIVFLIDCEWDFDTYNKHYLTYKNHCSHKLTEQEFYLLKGGLNE